MLDNMTIAVDFDGTIVEHRYPQIGEERPFATEILKRLIADRHKIILWTVRNGALLDEAVNWCKERGVVFYSINNDQSSMFDEEKNMDYSCKPKADLFIDDRNIGGLPDWPTIYRIINEKKTYRQILRKQLEDEFYDAEPPAPKWMFWKSSKR